MRDCYSVDGILTRSLNDAVRYKDLLDDAYADLSNLLKVTGDVCAIVYCLERTTCDDLSAHLSKTGISSAGNLQYFCLQNFISGKD